MRVGTIREIKDHEYRVGLTPRCVAAYNAKGHQVWVQKGAGAQAGFPDQAYAEAGAHLVASAQEVAQQVELLVKVKEPQPAEYPLLRPGLMLFTYLHLAAEPDLAKTLQAQRVQAIAYETIRLSDGSLPCLRPMSEIAGRLAVQEGAKYLEKTYGGRGVLLAGVPGVQRGRVVILGAGVVGQNACRIAVGMGAQVTILDINPGRLISLDDQYGARVQTLYATDYNIKKVLPEADVVIGAVLLPGARAPRLVEASDLQHMKPGAVLVDVAIDQGGCFATSRPTTHAQPVYVVDGIVHYCVTNMPGAVSLTSTLALTSTTLPYGLAIADLGAEAAVAADPALAQGVNVWNGNLAHPAVAKALSSGARA